MRTRLAGLLGVLLAIGACSGEAGVATTASSTSTTPIVTSTVAAATSTTSAPTTTAVVSTTSTTRAIDVTVSAGEVTGPDRFGFDVGDQVSVWVLSDIDDEIHVHGYDRYFETVAGTPFEIDFAADVPGIFEVELESSHLPLFELEVTP
ncbi:MAG TPA: hypothetical protein VF083_00415 [Acidimicrobiia bacterium]